MRKDKYEVIVVGGGPAGSTTATVLAQLKHDVLLLEREKFPRYHIGESFMPNTYWTLKRIGVWEKMTELEYTRKHSVQFVDEMGKASKPFYFFENNNHESAITWQVERSKFDQLLLENSREHGVEVHEEVRVLDALMDGEQVTGVIAQDKHGKVYHIHAQVVVDATGNSAILSRKFNIRKPDPSLQNTAVFSYYKGAYRDSGIDAGATLVLHTKDKKGWFWYIPLTEDVVSVGVVAHPKDLFTGSNRNLEETFTREVDNCVYLQQRIANATRCDKAYACSDFSYYSSRVAGPGYVLVGDAFGFIDPIYSSGVFLALKSGEMAADSIHAAFVKQDFSGTTLGSFGSNLITGMEAIKKLVYAFYDRRFSFARFLKDHPHFRQNIIDLLVGDFFKDGVDQVFETMQHYCTFPDSNVILEV